MCVPENRSLVWITNLLAQLASPDLQEITLVIKADSMRDLRALDSECGVRMRDPVRYSELTTLRWKSLDLTNLPSLGKLIVEGTDSPDAFLSDMHNLYPALARIICLRTVMM